MKPYPPLGILYICSHLRQKGLQRRSIRFHVFLAPGVVEPIAARSAIRSRSLCESDDPAECGRNSSRRQRIGLADHGRRTGTRRLR